MMNTTLGSFATMRKISATMLLITLSLTACNQPIHQPPEPDRPQPIFEGLGHHARAIMTQSPEAQAYFNQGLTWAFAFNYDEAIRSFKAATKHDPDCAMAWWGIALCNGPHINNPVMTDKQSREAWSALQKALPLCKKSGYPEQKLVEALAARYAENPPANRKPLDETYAAAMKEVFEMNINDFDIASLYAESLMDLQPWDLWTEDGKPKGRTEEILAVLERALVTDPRHPGANHLYIHALEASPHPEKADAAAEVLRTLIPLSGHLTHMPSHIDVQCGRWTKAADQNEAAIKADEDYRKISPRQDFNSVYMAHNHHFLAFAAMMEGRHEVALKAARTMIANVPPHFLREKPEFVDPYQMIALDVHKRFGRWDDILSEPAPPLSLPITHAHYHFTRGLAFAAKGRVEYAEDERANFKLAAKRVPPAALMGVNPAHKVLTIADHMLAGEIAFRRNQIDAALRELRAGVELEDTLLYMEPPEWVQPLRHTLGAVLLYAKRYDEAEAVYRKDLEHWPENAWSLLGLSKCLRAAGKTSESNEVQKRFEKAWARADVSAETSCLCVPGNPSSN
jgi:tetratricopeptide (TPR) repeat protein